MLFFELYDLSALKYLLYRVLEGIEALLTFSFVTLILVLAISVSLPLMPKSPGAHSGRPRWPNRSGRRGRTWWLIFLAAQFGQVAAFGRRLDGR